MGRWRELRSWRGFGFLLVLLQGALWISGPISEGVADARAFSVVAHVEDAGATSCAPANHSHDCQIGRTLGAGAVTSAGTPLVPAAEELERVRPRTVERGARDGISGALGSRAPPVV